MRTLAIFSLVLTALKEGVDGAPGADPLALEGPARLLRESAAALERPRGSLGLSPPCSSGDHRLGVVEKARLVGMTPGHAIDVDVEAALAWRPLVPRRTEQTALECIVYVRRKRPRSRG